MTAKSTSLQAPPSRRRARAGFVAAARASAGHATKPVGENVGIKAFISYSFEDAVPYDNLCATLDQAGLRRWSPQEILLGKSLSESLRSAVASCAVCILVASRRSLASQWCLAEVGAFWGSGKPVIVYLTDQRLRESDLPKQLQGNRWTSSAQEVVDHVRIYFDDAAREDLIRRSPYVGYQRDSFAMDPGKVNAIRTARREVWLIGAAGNRVLGGAGDLLRDKLANGLKVNLLVADPRGRYFETTAHSVGQTGRAVEQAIKAELVAARELQNSLATEAVQQSPLRVRLLDEVFTAEACFIDPGETGAQLFLVPHFAGRDTSDLPGLVFQSTSDGPLERYFDIHRRIWDRGVVLDDWLASNPTYLEPDPPAAAKRFGAIQKEMNDYERYHLDQLIVPNPHTYRRRTTLEGELANLERWSLIRFKSGSVSQRHRLPEGKFFLRDCVELTEFGHRFVAWRRR